MKHLLLFVGALSICAGSFAVCPKHGSSCGYANGGHLNGYRPAPPGQSNTTSNATPIDQNTGMNNRVYVYKRNDIPQGAKEVKIQLGYSSIEKGAFKDLQDVETVVIPYGVGSIRKETFKNCTNLKTVVIPASVVNIEAEAFAGCPNLKSVFIGPNVSHIDPTAFMSGCQLEIDSQNEYYSVNNGALLDLGNRELVKFISNDVTDYTVPGNIRRIKAEAFKDAKNLKSVHIPSTVRSIGKDAFAGCCDLVVVLPNKKTKSIDISCFAGCKSVSFE